jgi:serine/threonine protein phosphatase PrpC
VKRCPECDAPYADEDVFCEIDGTRLSGQFPPVPVSPAAVSAPNMADAVREAMREAVREAPTMAPRIACASCGAFDSDDGEGYCGSCGHRLETRATVSFLPPGATIGGRTIVATRAPDDVLARGTDDVVVGVTVGDAALLADEAAALRALDGKLGAPALVELGNDTRRGAFLVFAQPPAGARPLADGAKDLDEHAAIRLVRHALDVVEALEKAGVRWTPRGSDFHLDADGALVLSRVRVAPLDGGRSDACCPVGALGRSLVPSPAVRGTPALFRVLAGVGTDAPHEPRDADAIRADVHAAEEELLCPHDEGPRHAAQLCDPGLKRDHNEDATAVAIGETRGEPWTVLVVCDGVSCSSFAQQASTIAARTACDALAHFARSGDIAYEAASGAMSAAIRAAHVAVCASPVDRTDGEPPGTTIVAGLVYRRRLTVGWVGDSRAYWIAEQGSELLTRDHSWASETVARGEMTEEEAMRQPLAHALTRCLGPLEASGNDGPIEVSPEVRGRDLPGPGLVVLCTDGLWNYFPDARSISDLVHEAGPKAAPHVVARRLVNHALSRGGGDNVSVAIYVHD